MKLYPVFLVLVVVVTSSSSKRLGFRRVRSNGITENITSKVQDQPASAKGDALTPCCREESASSVSDVPCCKGRFFWPFKSSDPETPKEPSLPVNTSPIRPPEPQSGNGVKTTFGKDDYKIIDTFRQRPLTFFDPEIWVKVNPTYPFPPELDIPFQWSIYNPVTVQAPRPAIVQDLRNVNYSGYYYSCPNYVNPYEFSWFYNKEAVNPCKWIWYQVDQGVPY